MELKSFTRSVSVKMFANKMRIEVSKTRRQCQNLFTGEIEPEIHFLMDCSYSGDKRRLFSNFVQKNYHKNLITVLKDGS